MKKYLSLIILLLMIACIFGGCKKEANAAAPVKDYSASISDKDWWGSFNNAGESLQYYSVHFNADHSLLWTQISGDYTGNWAVDGNRLTLTFTAPAVTVKAEISDENKLVNITTNTPNKVNTGELVGNPTTSLDNSIWIVSRTHVPTDATILLKFTFIPNNKVLVFFGGVTNGPFPYTRSASGGSIRINTITQHFGVIISGTEMKGNFGDAEDRWQASKQ